MEISEIQEYRVCDEIERRGSSKLKRITSRGTFVDFIPKSRGKLRLTGMSTTNPRKTLRLNRTSRETRIMSEPSRKSIMKTEIYKTILIATPASVEFRNFEADRLYKRIVTLRNVSFSTARIRMEARPHHSRFTIMIESTEARKNGIPPGMQLKLIVLFRCDALDEPEELLVINVQQGRPVLVKLRGYRDPPILRTVESTCKKGGKSSIETWHRESTEIKDSNESSSITESSSDSLEFKNQSLCKETRGALFECGKCFVGEQINVSMRFKNIGGDGTFFVMSEIEWCSMRVENVTRGNTLTLPSFAIYPAYFALKSEEQICLRIYFFPDSYGIHIDRLYIVCNNCSVIGTEIIGDGVMYEPDFFKFTDEFQRALPMEVDIDGFPRYQVKVDNGLNKQDIQSTLFVINTSEIGVYFRWEQFSDNVHVDPCSGFFPSLSSLRFTILTNQYSGALKFFIEDVPTAAVSKALKLRTVECNTKRKRSCLTSLDIRVADVEVQLECAPIEFHITSAIVDDAAEYIDMHGEMIGDASIAHSRIITENEYHDDISNISEAWFPTEEVTAEKMRSLFRGKIISIGVLRPDRPLFVGIKETYTLLMKNVSCEPLEYTWGRPAGGDEFKMKICLYPRTGKIIAGDMAEIRIVMFPVETGIVRFFFVPCYVGKSNNILLLRVECKVESFYITFYLPRDEEALDSYTADSVLVEWHVDSLRTEFDFSKDCRIIRTNDISTRIRMQEEQELMTVDLDPGDIDRDVSVGPSVQGENESRKDSLESVTKYQSRENLTLPSSVVPFYKTVIPGISQPMVLEFIGVVPFTVRKRTFVIKNETAISSSFWISVNHFYPICQLKKRSEEKPMASIYEKILDCQKAEKEIWNRLKQPGSGIVIYVEPSIAQLQPHNSVAIDVYIFSDTWGIYTDVLEINVMGLPQYAIGICIEVTGSPISLPTCRKTSIFRFGTVRLSCPQTRKILIENTSVVPLAVNWHSFLLDPTSSELLPFNVVLNVCTPFANKFANILRKKRQEDEMEKLVKDYLEPRMSEEYSEDTGDSDFNSDDIHNDYTNEDTFSSFSSQSLDCVYSEELRIRGKLSKSYSQSKEHTSSATIDHTESDTTKNTEFEILLLPYNGLKSTESCIIRPEETLLPPKEKSFINVTITQETYPLTGDDKMKYKILGYIRIAQTDKYKDNQYSRRDGYFLSPVEIDVEARIVRPRLTFDISKFERTFTFCADAVMKSFRKRMKMRKTYLFCNSDEDEIFVIFQTNAPFRVEPVSSYDQIEAICVCAKGCIEVRVTCTVDAKLIEEIMETQREEDLREITVTSTEFLYIQHFDKSTQIIELFLKIQLPLLSLSSRKLDFGLVYVGDTKKLLLIIENMSVCKQEFKVSKKYHNEDFNIEPVEVELSPRPATGNSSTIITISFAPKNAVESIDKLEVITNIPSYVKKCILYGKGTLDEKYHLPGM